MTVDELLNRMDSEEYSRWLAYERATGLLGSRYTDESLAGLHEQLQTLNYLFSQANFTDKRHKKGPIPKPERYPRREDYLKMPDEPERRPGGDVHGDPRVAVVDENADEEWVSPAHLWDAPVEEYEDEN